MSNARMSNDLLVSILCLLLWEIPTFGDQLVGEISLPTVRQADLDYRHQAIRLICEMSLTHIWSLVIGI